jgi:GxxExxY protein
LSDKGASQNLTTQSSQRNHNGHKEKNKRANLASPGFEPLPTELNQLSRLILDCAFTVHKSLGPGLLETTYRLCLTHEIRKRGVVVERELALPIIYDGISFESGYRIDMLVGGLIVVELKAVESILAVHKAQLLPYLKHSEKRLGLLINFNSVLLKDGICRIINK